MADPGEGIDVGGWLRSLLAGGTRALAQGVAGSYNFPLNLAPGPPPMSASEREALLQSMRQYSPFAQFAAPAQQQQQQQVLPPSGLAQDDFLRPALAAPETPEQRTARQAREFAEMQHRHALELEQEKGRSGAAEATIRGQYALQAARLAHPGYRPIGEQLQLVGAEQSGQMQQLTTQLASAGTLAELRSRTDLALEGLRSDSAARIAQINADTSLSVAEKQRLVAQERNGLDLQIANITAASSRYAVEASREVGLHQANISERIAQINQEAETARAQGNTDLERERIAASERMQADLRVVDREKLALDQYLGERGFKQQERASAANLLTSIMGLQAQERSSRSQSAIELFKALASLAPQQNLVNAYFLLRGQVPPPSQAEAALGQLGPLLGLTQGQQGAIGQAAGVNQATLAPFLQELLGVQLQPTAAAAGA